MPSGLLHYENVIFYHPLDDLDEFVENKTWSTSDTEFIPGLLTNSVRSDPPGGTRNVLYTFSDHYNSLDNSDNVTLAIWVSGFLNSDNFTRFIEVGLGFSAPSIRNGITIIKGNSPDNFSIKSKVGNTSLALPWTPPPSNDSDWHLFIVDIRNETSGWRHRVSLDGNEWLDLGVYSSAATFNADTEPTIKFLINSTTGVNSALDETVLWGDNDLFTAQELSNLYELFNTNNTTMDQYESTYGIPINNSIDLFTMGGIATSGNISLYIPGQLETKRIDLFVNGLEQNSNNIDLYISGTPSVASSSIDLFMKVATPANSGIDLYISGPIFVSNNIDYFTHGYKTVSGSIDNYIKGVDVASGNADLYISGIPFISSSTDLYITGPIPVSGNIDHFTMGHIPVSGNFSLFINGPERFDAFVRVVANEPSDSSDLFMHGVPLGASGVSYTNNSISLFINDDGDNDPLVKNWSSFARVADPLTAPHSGSWSSFTRVGNTANNNIDLYINAHASGESPNGIPIISSFTMFINGLASQSGDEGLLSDGFLFLSDTMSSFARVHFGSSNSLDLYIFGEIPIVPPSATLDMFVFGILGIESGSFSSYIYGDDVHSDSNDLFVFGILGIESNSMPLYIEVTTSGSFIQESDLYTHGY